MSLRAQRTLSLRPHRPGHVRHACQAEASASAARVLQVDVALHPLAFAVRASYLSGLGRLVAHDAQSNAARARPLAVGARHRDSLARLAPLVLHRGAALRPQRLALFSARVCAGAPLVSRRELKAPCELGAPPITGPRQRGCAGPCDRPRIRGGLLGRCGRPPCGAVWSGVRSSSLRV